MIDREIVRKIRLSTCAILRMERSHEELLSGSALNSKVVRPRCKVIASGFLVRDDIVLTNRHVIAHIIEDQQSHEGKDHWYVQFSYPKSDGQLSEAAKLIVGMAVFGDPADVESLDIGLIRFKRSEEDELAGCRAVEFGDLESVVVGADVGICGFPFGNALLDENYAIYRFGPVIHHGIISGVSPFEGVDPRKLTSFLTDVNTAGGMSGSPIFIPASGMVIGLHFGGIEGSLGCALPIDCVRVDGWIGCYERAKRAGKAVDFPVITWGGDIVESP